MPRILAIDDSEFVCTVVRNVLTTEDIEIVTVGTAKEGIEYARKKAPDLVLLDVLLPDMDGFSTCIALKSLRETAEIPVIFITGRGSVTDMVRGFEVGAVDYISKPFNSIELKARANTHLKNKLMTDEMRTLNDNLMIALEENRRLAEVDPLTGLHNRRFGWDYMEQYLTNVDFEPSVLLMGDVDDFKKVNDQYGHNVGDTVLCRLAEVLKEMVGEKGIACRWGGEEVLIMLHGCTPLEGSCFGKKICESFNNISFQVGSGSFRCSITFGAALFDGEKPIANSINCADHGLYEGKKMGKNCCVLME